MESLAKLLASMKGSICFDLCLPLFFLMSSLPCITVETMHDVEYVSGIQK